MENVIDHVLNETLSLTPKRSNSFRKQVLIDFDIDLNFWAIIPALNLNFHGVFTFEFEWLCLGIYIRNNK